MKPVDLTRLPSVTAALASKAHTYDETGEFPRHSLEVVHEAGLLTATVGLDHGGPGLGAADLTRILLALGRGDPSVALIASMTQLVHLLQAHQPTWPESLYERVLATDGLGLLNTLRVEPDLGSPSRGGLPATVARRSPDGWVLNGRKRFSTGATGLDWMLIYAATDEPAPRVGNFVVPARTPGISIVPTWNQLGLRASGSHDVILADVQVRPDHFLASTAPPVASDALHLPLAAIYLGVGRAAQAQFQNFALSRIPSNLGRPVATTERFRAAAGEISVLLTTAERLLLDAASRFDAGLPVPDAAAARVIANRHAVAAVTLATRLLGNPGLSRDNPLERHFRDVQSALVHAPQEDLALQAIGKGDLMPA
ncbi:acyl-CoA dehydrogenase family protein [Actinoplanes sp. CA-142083]|uniref:acyl-CoA dehydrogenase family protein n=1 Tax=Actinoplanes sp. CA-142083 TaxID=3239903 RepID=UPI003D8C9434